MNKYKIYIYYIKMIPSLLKRSIKLNRPAASRSISVINDFPKDLSMSPNQKITLAEKLNYQKNLDIHYKNTDIIPSILLLEKKKNKSKEDKELLEIYHEMLQDTNSIINELDNDINDIYDSLEEDYDKLILKNDDDKKGGKKKRKTNKRKNKKPRRNKRKTNKKSRR